MRLVPTLVASFLLASASFAADIWVDAVNGNNGNPGTLALPLQSVTQGITLALPGDRVLVLPGTYSLTLTGEIWPIQVGIPPTNQQNVQIIGVGGAAVTVLDGEGDGNAGGLIRFRANGTGGRVSGLWLRNSTNAAGTLRIGTATTPSTFETNNIEVDRCIVSDGVQGIATFGQAFGLRIHDNLLHSNSDNNLWISSITAGSLGGGDVYNNTIVSGTNGIRVQGGSWNVFNNIVALNATNGIFDFGIVPPAVLTLLNDSNCVFGNGVDYAGIVPGGADVSVDPMFVSAGTLDFHLLPASPLIDAGTPVVPPYLVQDIDDDPRFVDSDASFFAAPEMGCDEVTNVRLVVASGSIGLGQTFTLDTTGPAGDLAAYFFSAGGFAFTLQPWGTVLLDPTQLFSFFPSGIIPAAATPSVTVPADPSLAGAFIHAQTLVLNLASPPLGKLTNKIVGAL